MSWPCDECGEEMPDFDDGICYSCIKDSVTEEIDDDEPDQDAGTCGEGPIVCGVCWRCQLEEANHL